MIYTVTLNPAIDNVIQTEAFQKGHINRACREYIFPGGKGVNVSLVLERLGIETVALGFLAGATGKAYQALLQENGLNHGFLGNGTWRWSENCSPGVSCFACAGRN